MKLLTTLALILFSFQLYGQEEFSSDFGRVNLQDLTFKKYAKDTNAEAVMLYDIGKSNFYDTDKGFSLLFQRSSMIRIIKKAGISWSEVEIPYYYEGDAIEQVYDIEAGSYNIEDGVIKRTPLNLKTVYDEKVNEYWRMKKFAIPNVREGSVIEYRYTVRSPFLFNLRDWEFQHKIPAVYSEYTAAMVPFYDYIYVLQGKSKFDVFGSTEDHVEQQYGPVKYHELVYKFGMRDVPAFNDESFITSENDYLMKIDFQLTKVHPPNGFTQEVISTWPKLSNDLLKEQTFGKYCSAAEKSAKDVLNLAELSVKDKQEQLEYIVNFVKNTYSWNGNSNKYANKTLKEFQKEKTGNCANINLYLTGLLRAAGLEASPVLISTRGNGSVYKDYPFLHFFNYVIVLVKINEKYILTDATDVLCPYNRIPSRCLNNMGLIIKKDAEEWAKLVNPEISKIDKHLFIDFNLEEDSLNFNTQSKFSVYEAYDYKAKYKNDLTEITKSLYTKGYHHIDSLVTGNYDNPLGKYSLNYSATIPFDKIGEKIYISPFLNEPLAENPLKQTTRTYPVDFTYPFGKTFISEVKIPEGYKVEFLPDPLVINNAMVSVDYKAMTLENSKITVTGIYAFKNAVYESTDYKSLKYIYNEIIKKFNEKIVFVKI